MHFQITAAVRLDRGFHRLIDKLYARADRHVIEQVFDIVGAQAHAAVADAQADAEVGISAVDRVQATDIQRIQPHRVIRAGREHRRQDFPFRRVLFTHFGGRRPGRAVLLALYTGDPVHRRVFAQLTDTDRQHHHGVAALRIVIQTHFRAVDNNALTRRIRQNQLLRDGQRAAGLRQEGIDARVGFQHIAQTHLVLRRKAFQRQLAVLRDLDLDILPHQTAVFGRQRVNNGEGGLAERHQGRKQG
ncbi:hypothetical protein GGER_05930 [Serratia rubidaea]